MRHGRKVKKLGRTAAHRKAMLSNMATSLIMHSTIKTTPVKARAVCRVMDRLVTLAKRGDLHARRQAAMKPLMYCQKSVSFWTMDILRKNSK